MPNHLHGIIVIENDGRHNNVETHCNASLQKNICHISFMVVIAIKNLKSKHNTRAT